MRTQALGGMLLVVATILSPTFWGTIFREQTAIHGIGAVVEGGEVEEGSGKVAIRIERRGRDGAEMVFVPGGSPLVPKAFWIDRYEVTNAQYRRFVEETRHEAPAYWGDPAFNQPDHPVVGVSWEDAFQYAQWVGKRLPTWAEWERAAGGDDGRAYPWGEAWSPGRCNSVGGQDGFDGTAPVGSFPSGASPYGAMDMAGNVWEWVANGPESGPWEGGQFRWGRGGSWANGPEGVRISARARGEARLADCIIGFRCAMDGE